MLFQPASVRVLRYDHTMLFCLAGCALLMGALSAVACSYYDGSWLRVGGLTALCFGGIAVSLTMAESPFSLLVTVFLALGFWAKFIAHFVVGTPFIEPIGQFDNSPEAWDRALLIASTGCAGFISGIAGSLLLGPLVKRPITTAVPPLIAGYGRLLLGVSLAFALAIFAVNFHFAILRIGFVPRIMLHPYAYVAVAFLVSWGFLLGLLSITCWLVLSGRLAPSAIWMIGSLEGALAAFSMGSRVQMILHVLAAAITYTHVRRLGFHLRFREWVRVAIVTTTLFVTSLLGVSFDRAVSFASAVTPPPVPLPQAQGVQKPAVHDTRSQTTNEATSEQPISEEQFVADPSATDHTAPTKAGGITHDRAETEVKEGTTTSEGAFNQTPLPHETQEAAVRHRIAVIPYELSRLVIMRWVGLEGILATVGASERLGGDLFIEGLYEQPSAGTDSIYQRMAGTPYDRFTNFVFMTIPGPIAVSFYSGSLMICFFSMFGIALGGILIEAAVSAVARSVAASAVAGTSLAYLVVQLNFPRTLFFFTIELMAASLALGLVFHFANWLSRKKRGE